MNSLPDELLLKILSYLPLTELDYLGLVSRSFCRLSSDGSLYANMDLDFLAKAQENGRQLRACQIAKWIAQATKSDSDDWVRSLSCSWIPDLDAGILRQLLDASSSMERNFFIRRIVFRGYAWPKDWSFFSGQGHVRRFPRLKILDLSFAKGLPPDVPLNWSMKAPQLEILCLNHSFEERNPLSLSWHSEPAQAFDSLSRVFGGPRQGACFHHAHITRLELRACHVDSAYSIVRIFAELPSLTHLDVSKSVIECNRDVVAAFAEKVVRERQRKCKLRSLLASHCHWLSRYTRLRTCIWLLIRSSVQACNFSGINELGDFFFQSLLETHRSHSMVLTTYQLARLTLDDCPRLGHVSFAAMGTLFSATLTHLSLEYHFGVSESELLALVASCRSLVWMNVSDCRLLSPRFLRSLLDMDWGHMLVLEAFDCHAMLKPVSEIMKRTTSLQRSMAKVVFAEAARPLELLSLASSEEASHLLFAYLQNVQEGSDSIVGSCTRGELRYKIQLKCLYSLGVNLFLFTVQDKIFLYLDSQDHIVHLKLKSKDGIWISDIQEATNLFAYKLVI